MLGNYYKKIARSLLLCFTFLLCYHLNAEVHREQSIAEVRSLYLANIDSSITNILHVELNGLENTAASVKIEATSRIFQDGLDEYTYSYESQINNTLALQIPITLENESVTLDVYVQRQESIVRGDWGLPIQRFKVNFYKDWQLISDVHMQNSLEKPWSEYIANHADQQMAGTINYSISGHIHYKQIVKGAFEEMNAIGIPLNLYVKLKNYPFFYKVDATKVTVNGEYNLSFQTTIDPENIDYLTIGFMYENDLICLNYFSNQYYKSFDYILDDGGYPNLPLENGIGIKLSPNITNFNIPIEVSSDIGIPFRRMEFTMGLFKRIFGTELPFQYEKPTLFNMNYAHPDYRGLYKFYNKTIYIYENTFESEEKLGLTLNHEYGHHFHHLMIGFNNLFEKKFVEGTAEFFKDIITMYEEAFQPVNADLTHEYDHSPLDDFDDSPFKSYDDYWDFVSYLLNIYDGPNSWIQGLMPNNTKGDNEDLDGGNPSQESSLSHNLFETYLEAVDVQSFKENFKNRFSSKVQESINAMDTHEISVHLADNFTDYRSYPPQVSSVMIAPFPNPNELKLSIQGQDYFSLASMDEKQNVIDDFLEEEMQERLFIHNIPKGYRLYKKSGNEWQLKKSFLFKYELIPTYSYTTNQVAGTYKITSYNEKGEPMQEGVEFTVGQPLSGSIVGKDEIDDMDAEFWQVNLDNAIVQDVKWYLRFSNLEEYEFQPDQGIDFNKNYKEFFNKNFYLQAKVMAKDGRTIALYKYVTVNLVPFSAKIIGMGWSYANQTRKYTCEVYNGTPPYKYTWGIRYDGDFFPQKLSYQKNYHVAGEKHYNVSVHIEDANGIITISDDFKVIVVDGPAVIEIQGPKSLGNNALFPMWQANVYGGKPPYEYFWMLKKEGDNLFSIIGTGETLTYEPPADVTSFYLKAGINDQFDDFYESEPMLIEIFKEDKLGLELDLQEVPSMFYPNPADDQITITSEEDIEQITLVDILGTRQNVEVIGDKIQTYQLQDGMYYLNLIDKEGRAYKRILEIRH